MSAYATDLQAVRSCMESAWNETPATEYGPALFAEAGVRATLMLVEQQRIASLIALAEATNADGSKVYSPAIAHPSGSYGVTLNKEIKEALGIE